MIYKVCGVFDRKAGAYGRPVFGLSIGAMIRSFQDEVNRVAPDNVMNAHAADFELYELGEFDDASGKFVQLSSPSLIAVGAQMVLPLPPV